VRVPRKTRVAPGNVIWDERNLRHLRERRRCQVPEVEQVLLAICHTSRRQRLLLQPGDPTKWKYFGETWAARCLVVIAEEADAGVRPVTCWPLVGRERARYLAWRETRKASR
jgi:hypothetical protein